MSIFSSPIKFTLQFTERCGEISYSNVNKEAVCVCVFCGQNFVRFTYFVKHIEQRHLNKPVADPVNITNSLNNQTNNFPFNQILFQSSNNEFNNNLNVEDNKPIEFTNGMGIVRNEVLHDPLDTHDVIKVEPNETQVEQTTAAQEKTAEEQSTNLIDIAEIKTEIDCDVTGNAIEMETSFNIPNDVKKENTDSLEDGDKDCSRLIFPAVKVHAIENKTATETSRNMTKGSEQEYFDSSDEDIEDDEKDCSMPKSPAVKISSEVVFALIKELEKHPNLWKGTHEDYSNNMERSKTYDILTKELQRLFPNEQVHKRWVKKKTKSLLDSLRKCAKEGDVPSATSKYYDALKFLKENMIEKPAVRKPITFKCTLCAKEFANCSKLRDHMRRHRKEYSVKCDICSKQFYHNSHLRLHMVTHTREIKHVCEICGRAFRISNTLNQHRKRHFNQRDHKCSVCPKAFYCTVKLRDHMASHTKNYTEKCEICDRMFKTKSCMKRHMEIHNPVKRFPCSLCGKAFSQSSQRSMHMRSHRI